MAEEGGGEGMLVGGVVGGGEEGECTGDKDNYSKRVYFINFSVIY